MQRINLLNTRYGVMLLPIRNFGIKLFSLLTVSYLLSGCGPEGLINKTKYNGKKVTNTCKNFETEAKAMLASNMGQTTLRVSEYDNSQFDYFYLEPGQYEIKGDTLYFRMIGDMEYGKYLTKGVAVHVTAEYSSQEHLKNIESEPQGQLGMLVIDESYYKANNTPFFLYKIPVGKKLDGRQVILKFSIVQYKKGKVAKVFCNTVEVPLGPMEPNCCTDQPWEQVNTGSLVILPDINIKDENYRYKGFQGTLDLIFPMSSTKFNENELTDVITNYLAKYEAEGFKANTINIEGYASQGGTEEFNQKLSEARSLAVFNDLTKKMPKEKAETIKIEYSGKGEDWERFDLLTKTAVMTDEERKQVLTISASSATKDEKEAELRKLPHWDKLVKEVLENCRHTFITFTFDYQPDKMYTEMYPSKMPVISPELYNVATKKMTIGKYIKGTDAQKGLRVLNMLIPNNEKANLFAMRCTYLFGINDIASAIKDIEKAQSLDKNNQDYAMASLAFKTKFASNYSLDERMKMLDAYNDYAIKYPNNKGLYFNRAVMMEKVGFISGALAEYSNLITESSKTATGLNNRGVAELKTNRFAEAEADFKEAISLDPSQAEPYFNLALIYAYKGLPDKCVENLDKAIEINPKYKDDVMTNPVFSVMRDNPKFSKYK